MIASRRTIKNEDFSRQIIDKMVIYLVDIQKLYNH